MKFEEVMAGIFEARVSPTMMARIGLKVDGERCWRLIVTRRVAGLSETSEIVQHERLEAAMLDAPRAALRVFAMCLQSVENIDEMKDVRAALLEEEAAFLAGGGE